MQTVAALFLAVVPNLRAILELLARNEGRNTMHNPVLMPNLYVFIVFPHFTVGDRSAVIALIIFIVIPLLVLCIG